MVHVSLRIYYLLIAVSCLHCLDATFSQPYAHNNLSAQSVQPHWCLLLKYLLPFINCVWSVLVFTDPDQLGVRGFVKTGAFWEFLTEIYGAQTAMVQVKLRCAISSEPLPFAQVERPHLKLTYKFNK